VHVLHAFQKKSKSGIATPQPDVELIEKRLKTVLARNAASRRT
jgi:phage-related protein